ncbi:hypothetical protein BCM20_004720 [Clostridium beijerinckii]|nr:hypothetical protein [Clostridium beijerinckii]NYC04714.1 hypothetical protein [Clostridium beijerinckii]
MKIKIFKDLFNNANYTLVVEYTLKEEVGG